VPAPPVASNNPVSPPASTNPVSPPASTNPVSPPASDNSTAVTDRAVKWHPGHYVDIPICPQLLQAACYNQVTAFIDTIAADSNVKGIMIPVVWSSMEGPTAGDYSRAYTWMDTLLAYLNSHGNKKLILRFMPGVYNGYGAFTTILPDYLVPTGNGGTCDSGCPYHVTPNTTILAANVWEQPTMDRLIALVNAIGARYDGNSALETWVYAFESTFAWEGTPLNWSQTAYNSQLKRLALAERNAFPHTNIWHITNWTDYASQMPDLVDYYTRSDIYVSLGAHDWMPQGGAGWANQFLAGAGVQGGIDFGTNDRRTQVPYFAYLDEPELCDGRTSKPNADALHNWAPQEFYDFGQKTGAADTSNKPLLPTHEIWIAHSGWSPTCVAVGGVSNQTWNGCTSGGTCGSTGSFRDFIDQGTHPTRSACPTLYPGCNTH
jgi:hypothetical protein